MCAGFRSVVRTSPCTVGLGSPTRCPRCHASLEMVTFACVYSLCLYIGRFSCHVHYSRLVLSLTHLVSLALSKDHTTVIRTHLYVCIYHCLNSKETTEVRRMVTWEKDQQPSPKPVTYALMRCFSNMVYGIGHALSSHIAAYVPVTGVPNPRPATSRLALVCWMVVGPQAWGEWCNCLFCL